MRLAGLWVGALALLVQVFAWTLTMPAVDLAADLESICTADGLSHGPSGDGPAGNHDPAQHAGAGHCPLCPLIGGLHLPPPLVQPTLPQSIAHHGPEALPGDMVVAGWFLSTLQARAPPV